MISYKPCIFVDAHVRAQHSPSPCDVWTNLELLSEPDQVSEESGEHFGVMCAAFLAAKGRTKQLDLLPTECADKKYLAFLTVGWGMIRCGSLFRSTNEACTPAFAGEPDLLLHTYHCIGCFVTWECVHRPATAPRPTCPQ